MEIKGFYISYAGDPSVGIFGGSFVVNGGFYFEDKEEMEQFRKDLQDLFEAHVGERCSVSTDEEIKAENDMWEDFDENDSYVPLWIEGDEPVSEPVQGTVAWWLNQLPSPQREQADANCKLDRNFIGEYKDMTDFILGAFVWSSSPQGHQYWEDFVYPKVEQDEDNFMPHCESPK